DQHREVAPDERLASRQPHVADPDPDRQPYEALDLLEGQDLRPLEPRQPVGRHAVLAAAGAAVGERDPEVGDQPARPVPARLHPSIMASAGLQAGISSFGLRTYFLAAPESKSL